MEKREEITVEIHPTINGTAHVITICAGECSHTGQYFSNGVKVKVDGGAWTHNWSYDQKAKTLVFRMICTPFQIDGVPLKGIDLGLSPESQKLADHLDAALARYQAAFDAQVKAVISGKLLIYLGSNPGMLVLGLDDSERDDKINWIDVIKEAQKLWVRQRYPLVKSYDVSDEDLTAGLWSTRDAAQLPGAIPSEERHETMDELGAPDHVHVPLNSLMQRIEDHYLQLNAEYQAAHDTELRLAALAKQTGKKQVLSRYLSDECLDNLPDCSFDSVTIWIDSDGKRSHTYTHCH